MKVKAGQGTTPELVARLKTLEGLVSSQTAVDSSVMSKAQSKKLIKQTKEIQRIKTTLDKQRSQQVVVPTSSNSAMEGQWAATSGSGGQGAFPSTIPTSRPPYHYGTGKPNPAMKTGGGRFSQQNRMRNVPPQGSMPIYGNTGPAATAYLNSQYHDQSQPAAVNTSAVTGNRSAREVRDEIVPPSAESGGVPDPHPAYLQQSLQPSQTQKNLQSILVVIDLNGTLLYRPDRHRPTHFVERPFAQHFLLYMLSNFKVMIWSSAKPENVNNMCKKLFAKDQKERLLAVWARDNMGLSAADYNKRVQCYKRMDLIWGDPKISRAHPRSQSGGRWNQTNTILIDDSFEKARSEPFNLVAVPDFKGEQEDPDTLRKVAEYLDLVKFQSDVSAYMRAKPFKLDEIVINRSPKELARLNASRA